MQVARAHTNHFNTNYNTTVTANAVAPDARLKLDC